MAFDIIGFLLCALLIFFSGNKLAYYGDIISEKSGLGKIWIGLLLMATVTSLPELMIGISSVSMVGSADLAVGNVLGSCIFNLALLSLLDALVPGEPVLSKVAQTQILAATLGTILVAMVGLGLFDNTRTLTIGWIGVISIAFTIVYLASMKLLHSLTRMEMRSISHQEDLSSTEIKSELRKAIKWYSVHACIVIGASLVVPFFAENIAEQTGLGESFVGTLFLAASTSLPEMAVCISAVRIGSIDIAVGNLFGSNIFNVFTLVVDDVFYMPGDLLKDASESNIITVFCTIIMGSIAIAGLIFRTHKKRFFLALDTLLILLVYIVNMIVLFYFKP